MCLRLPSSCPVARSSATKSRALSLNTFFLVPEDASVSTAVKRLVLSNSLTRCGTDIHGVPGTGKTATVHSVVRELQNDSVSRRYRALAQSSTPLMAYLATGHGAVHVRRNQWDEDCRTFLGFLVVVGVVKRNEREAPTSTSALCPRFALSRTSSRSQDDVSVAWELNTVGL